MDWITNNHAWITDNNAFVVYELHRRYAIEDAGNKSFLLNMYFDYNMMDSKPVINQVNELNDIAIKCADPGKLILETLQVSTFICYNCDLKFKFDWN